MWGKHHESKTLSRPTSPRAADYSSGSSCPPQASRNPGLRPSAFLPVKWNHSSGTAQPNQPGQSVQQSGAVVSPALQWASTMRPGQPPTPRSIQPTSPAVSIPPVQMPNASRAVQSKVIAPAPPGRPSAPIPPVRMPHDTSTSQHSGNGSNPTGAMQRHTPRATHRSRPAVSIPPVRYDSLSAPGRAAPGRLCDPWHRHR